ncbi:chromosomal replication initiation ATPase DnaA [Bradyrhizobium sp. S3.9.2]|uniref:helix-turn-helix domain-containing protein n=1 Tax=Bradyrhizobium sp. S3.9.2 TaxID=3156432 RepID=UPI00339ABB99
MDQPVGRRIFADDYEELERLSVFLERARPSLSEIKDVVCDFYCVSVDEVEGRRRFVTVVFTRQIFCFFARKYSKASLRMIGMRAGGLDHTTVHHAIRRIEHLALVRPLVRDDLDLLRLRIADKIMKRVVVKGTA